MATYCSGLCNSNIVISNYNYLCCCIASGEGIVSLGICVCLYVCLAVTARCISLGSKSNAVYSVLSSYIYICFYVYPRWTLSDLTLYFGRQVGVHPVKCPGPTVLTSSLLKFKVAVIVVAVAAAAAVCMNVKKRLKLCIALHGKPISELRGVTCLTPLP